MGADARVRGDRGSIIPMILMAFVVAGLVIVGSVVAGGAFLAQRDLQSVCDGAAIAGAQALDDPEFYANGIGSDNALPLGGVQSAVSRYAAQDATSPADRAAINASVGDDHVTVSVVCTRTTHLTFGSVFGYGSGLRQHATASARSRTTAPLTAPLLLGIGPVDRPPRRLRHPPFPDRAWLAPARIDHAVPDGAVGASPA